MKRRIVDACAMLLLLVVLALVVFNNLAHTELVARELQLKTKISDESSLYPGRSNKFKNGSLLNPSRRYKIAIAIPSSFDWEERPPYASGFMRRQMHRDTWMQHPAVHNDTVLVYFLVGNRQVPRIQGNPKDATHNVAELQREIDHYGDVVLLNAADVHNNGKMNAWYEWAPSNIQADYHMKLDDESYLLLDRLLEDSKSWPLSKFLGGRGQAVDRKYGPTGELLKNVSWIRGWGYIMSADLVDGLRACSKSKKLVWNTEGGLEDCYNAVALRVCGLDKNITVRNTMQFQDLTQVLATGCPRELLDPAILFHGGAVSSLAFSMLPDVTFSRLHNIFSPLNGDLIPAWAKWESLRHLYIEGLRVCENRTGDWSCRTAPEHRTCVPTKQRDV